MLFSNLIRPFSLPFLCNIEYIWQILPTFSCNIESIWQIHWKHAGPPCFGIWFWSGQFVSEKDYERSILVSRIIVQARLFIKVFNIHAFILEELFKITIENKYFFALKFCVCVYSILYDDLDIFSTLNCYKDFRKYLFWKLIRACTIIQDIRVTKYVWRSGTLEISSKKSYAWVLIYGTRLYKRHTTTCKLSLPLDLILFFEFVWKQEFCRFFRGQKTCVWGRLWSRYVSDFLYRELRVHM